MPNIDFFCKYKNIPKYNQNFNVVGCRCLILLALNQKIWSFASIEATSKVNVGNLDRPWKLWSRPKMCASGKRKNEELGATFYKLQAQKFHKTLDVGMIENLKLHML